MGFDVTYVQATDEPPTHPSTHSKPALPSTTNDRTIPAPDTRGKGLQACISGVYSGRAGAWEIANRFSGAVTRQRLQL